MRTAVVATLLAAPALAETHKIPESNPVVTVVVPDKGWSASEIARGIEVNDDDDEVYLAIEAIDDRSRRHEQHDDWNDLHEADAREHELVVRARVELPQHRRVDDGAAERVERARSDEPQDPSEHVAGRYI